MIETLDASAPRGPRPTADPRPAFTWNGRTFIVVREGIPRGDGDTRAIEAFYRATEDAFATMGYIRWSAAARLAHGRNSWTATITLVGPGQWDDPTFVEQWLARG